MLLKRNNVCSTLTDNRNRTPLSLAISAGHEGIARILQERDHPNFQKTNHSSPESLPPSPEHECAAEMEVRSHHANIDITGFGLDHSDKANDSGRSSLPPSIGPADEFVDNFNSGQANHGSQEVLPPPPRSSRLLSIWPLKLLHRSRKN